MGIARRAACAIAALVLGLSLAAPSGALLTATTVSPANALATGSGLWFAANATGLAICVGVNDALACPFGTRRAGTTVASFTLGAKASAASFRVAVVDGAGPAGISTILTVAFASTGAAAATIAAGASDTVDLTLKLKGATPRGTYSGTITVTDTASGLAVAIPVSVTF